MNWKSNWAEARKHHMDWWNHQGLVAGMWGHGFPQAQPVHDLHPLPFMPAVALAQEGRERGVAPDPQDWETYRSDPECMSRRWHAQLAHCLFPADTLPIMQSGVGTVELAAYLGATVNFQKDMLWYEHVPETDGPIRFDPDNKWFVRMRETLRRSVARATGKYAVGMPAIAPGLDTLAELHGTQELLVSMIERPDWVLGKLEEIDRIYFDVYDRFHEIIRQPDGSVFFYYFMLWGPGRVSLLQCDVAAMISADMFREFVIPGVRRCCDWLDYSLFHVDGPGMLKHIDALCEVESLDAIEYTPGPGVPRGADPYWHDYYKRILAAGKSVQVVWMSPQDVEPLLDAIGAKGVYMMVECATAGEMEAVAKTAERYR
jgi:hypothetical protein